MSPSFTSNHLKWQLARAFKSSPFEGNDIEAAEKEGREHGILQLCKDGRLIVWNSPSAEQLPRSEVRPDKRLLDDFSRELFQMAVLIADSSIRIFSARVESTAPSELNA
jgi:hypothetical protein